MTLYQPHEVENEIQEYWATKKIPEKIVKFDKKKKKFYLLDGPPYVNYVPHVGHVKTTTFKDVWSKFKAMQGFSSWWQPGFDCSGLPIENAVEKKLGITSKQDIEKLGVTKFIAECKQLAEKNKPLWMDLYQAIGAWRGWVDPYLTYKNSYLESGWWSVKQMYERGLLVEGEKSGYWCSHCETVLAGYEVTDSYKQVTDPSIYIKFPLKGDSASLLAWTTTPWTLTSNVAIAVHPDEMYVKITVTTPGDTHAAKGDQLILAKKRLQVLDDLGMTYIITDTFPGKRLEGRKYLGVLDTPLQKQMDSEFHEVILSIKLLKKRAASKVDAGEDVFEDFVTMDAGTGLVHTAPGLGDAKLGQHYKLPALSPINDQGCFTDQAGPYHDLHVKKADKAIIADLETSGRLLHAGTINHSYPLCWRCKTPLIYRMSKQWFVTLDTLREKILKENKGVKWLPDFARERFREVVETAPDWAVTRQRYWGIPLPVWICDACQSKRVIGSVSELRTHATKRLPEDLDLHKDVVDAIQLTCECGESMTRVRDIMDVWFDSGIAPWASLGYPYKNKDLFEQLWPVDLIDESQDQTRGWFYTLMLCGHAVHGETPYKTVCLNGWTLDGKGEKMSKSVGNVVWAEDAHKDLGADTLRLSYCTDVAPWETQKFSAEGTKEVARALNVLWNTMEFVQTYGARVKEKHLTFRPEDRWILSRVNSLTGTVTESLEKFAFHTAGRSLVDFILNDFSRWYIKLVRDRVSPTATGPSKLAAQYCMQYVLERITLLLAPFAPFITEKIARSFNWESVHLKKWPKPEKAHVAPNLEKEMDTIKQVIEALLAERQEKKMKLRWPVDKAFVQTKEPIKDLVQVIATIGNVKDVVLVTKLTTKGRAFQDGTLALGKVLKDDALVRELIRKVQETRKANKLQVTDKITLVLETDKSTGMILDRFGKDIRQGTGASRLTLGPAREKKATLEFDSKVIHLSF